MICVFPRILSLVFLTQAKKYLELYVVFIMFYAKEVQTVLLDSSSLPWHPINGAKKIKVMRRSVVRFTLLLQEQKFFITEHIFMSLSVVSFTLNFKKTSLTLQYFYAILGFYRWWILNIEATSNLLESTNKINGRTDSKLHLQLL